MPKKFSKEKKEKLKALTNRYIVYEKGMVDRVTITNKDKQEKLTKMIELNEDTLAEIYDELINFWYDSHGVQDGAEYKSVPVEEAGIAAGLTKEQRNLLTQYISYSHGGKVQPSERITKSVGSIFFKKFAEETMKKKTKRKQSVDAAEGEGVSNDAANGCKEILRWLYKHGEVRTLAKEGGQKTGKSMMPFLEAIANRPISQQARIFYLVCVDHTHQCTERDLREAVVTGPNLNDFRKKMNITKWKFWTRLTGNKMKWDKLSAAVVLVDQKYRGKAVPNVDIKKEEEKKAEELRKQYTVVDKAEDIDINDNIDNENKIDKIDNIDNIDNIENIENIDSIDNIDNSFVRQSNKEANSIQAEMNPELLLSEMESEKNNDQELVSDDPKLQGMEKNKKSESAKELKAAKKDNASEEGQEEGNIEKSEDEAPKNQRDYTDLAEVEKIKWIEDELEKLRDMDNSNPEKAEKIKFWAEELKKVLDSQKTVMSASVGTVDETSWKIELGNYASYAATVFENVPFMETTAGLAFCFDGLALASRIRFLMNNPDLNDKEIGEQVTDIGRNVINIGKDITRIVDLTKFVKAGNTVKEAGELLSNGAFNTASNALGIVSGAATIAKGSIQMRESKQMKNASDKAKKRLDRVDNLEGDDELYANDLTGFVHSQSRCREAKAAYNIVNGAMSTITSAISLTGLGAILGVPFQIAGYLAMGIGWLVKAVRKSKEKTKVLNRFFGIDAAIDAYNQELYQRNNLMPKSDSDIVNKKKRKALEAERAKVKMDSGVEKMFREELLAYGEAMIGCSSHDGAINFIQSTYAEYLWNTVFTKKSGGMYHTAKDYEGEHWENDESEPVDDRIVRFACRDLVEGTGTHCEFSKDGKTKPKTTISEIKRRLILD